MKVYLIFDRYGCDEWYSLDYVGTKKTESIKRYQTLVKDMIDLGPDDNHSYCLVCVTFLTRDEYNILRMSEGCLIQDGEELTILSNVFQGLDPVTDLIFMTNGLSEVDDCFEEFLNGFGEKIPRDTPEWEEELEKFKNMKIYDLVLSAYLKKIYK